MPTKGSQEPIAPRLLRMIQHNIRTQCWMWLGSRQGKGYGSIKYQGRIRQAHAVSYEVFVGPIPDGMQLDHLCAVKHCINPKHLEPVTGRENTRRAFRRREACRNGHPLADGHAGGTCAQCRREGRDRQNINRQARRIAARKAMVTP